MLRSDDLKWLNDLCYFDSFVCPDNTCLKIRVLNRNTQEPHHIKKYILFLREEKSHLREEQVIHFGENLRIFQNFWVICYIKKPF